MGWVAYHPRVGAAGKCYPESLNNLMAHLWTLSYNLDSLGLRRWEGLGPRRVYRKIMALRGNHPPKSNVGRREVTLNISVIVEFCILFMWNYMFKNQQKVYTWQFPSQQFSKYLSNCRVYMILHYLDNTTCSKINKKYMHDCFHPNNFQSISVIVEFTWFHTILIYLHVQKQTKSIETCFCSYNYTSSAFAWLFIPTIFKVS